MPFKIVQTIENDEICRCIVPSYWEQDGVLYWPKRSEVNKLSEDEWSIPNEKWERIKCTCKKVFSSRNEASSELEKMERKSNSEELPPPKKFAPVELMRPGVSTTSSSVSTFTHSRTDHPESQWTDELSSSFLLNLQNDSIPNSTETQPTVGRTDEFIDIKDELMNADMSEIITTRGLLEHVLSNQNKIMTDIAKLETTFQLFMKKCTHYSVPLTDVMNESAATTELGVIPFQPIKSVDDFNDIEEKLKDEKYMSEIVDCMTFICGSSGRAKGINCCYKLIDYFINREFLMHCSWTGNARGSGENGGPSTKLPLKFYEYFRKCFLIIVRRADHVFSEADCDTFFKRIMRNSRQRTHSKIRVSRHKCRPKKIKIKLRKLDLDNSAGGD